MTRSPGDGVSASQARTIALTAQGFGRPGGDLLRVADALGAVQIDAVNVLIRSHYLPFYSRLGPYDRGLLDNLCYRQHAIFEYLGHAASLLPARLHPVLRWRMAGYAEHKNWARVPRPGGGGTAGIPGCHQAGDRRTRAARLHRTGCT